MRGLRVSKDVRRVDVVLTSARYDAQGRLDLAKGYLRRGLVWSDVVLLRREELIDMLRSGLRVVVGRPRKLPGDFDIGASVRLDGSLEGGRLSANGSRGEGDQLGLPLF